MTLLQQLGKRIRFLRTSKGWSQLTLAIESDVNRNYLSDLERGRRNPSIEILQQIVEALSIDLTTLFKGIKPIE